MQNRAVLYSGETLMILPILLLQKTSFELKLKERNLKLKERKRRDFKENIITMERWTKRKTPFEGKTIRGRLYDDK